MTLGEIVAVCEKADGLPVIVLAAQRLRDGKRLPAPKRINRSLPVKCIGGSVHDWHMAVRVADVARFALHHPPGTILPLREIQPAEKLSPAMRRMCKIADPPADPWATHTEGADAVD